MRTKGKIFLMITGCAAVLVIAVFSALLLLHVNSYKAQIDDAVSEATGLKVTIRGKISLSLFPLGISAKDVHGSSARVI